MNKSEFALPTRAPKRVKVHGIRPGIQVMGLDMEQDMEPDLPPGGEGPPDLPVPEAESEEKPGSSTAILALGAAAIVLIAASKRR